MNDVESRRVVEHVGDGAHHPGFQAEVGYDQLRQGRDTTLDAAQDRLYQHIC